jgi:hypothetical protein
MKGYEKIQPKELPIITLMSGPNISHIRDAIQYYCQQNLGEISAIFVEGVYRPPATANFSEETITADTTGILRSQALAKAKRSDVANEKLAVCEYLSQALLTVVLYSVSYVGDVRTNQERYNWHFLQVDFLTLRE